MHFFRRRPCFFFPSSSSSSFRPSPALAHACQIQHLKFHRVLLPTSGRGGRMLDSPGALAPLSPPFLPISCLALLLLSSPLPARLVAWLAMCVCVARARLKFQFVASSSHVAAAAPLVSTSARPSARPSSSCRRRVRSPSRFPSPGGDGSLPFPAGEGGSSLFFFAGGGRAISVCTQPLRSTLYGTLPWQTHRC